MINQDFLKTLTILYVEDEEVARTKLTKLLERFFKKVIVASNGEEGYITYQKEMLHDNIDLILSDINMPKMNGIEMLERIRESNDEIPIVYTTARTEPEYLLKAIELNANHYILKPIDIEDTITKIQEVCEKKYYQSLVKQKNVELEQYSSILDNVAAVFKLDSKKDITFINELLLENFNEKKENIIGKNIASLLHNEVSTTLVEEIWSKIKKSFSWQGNIKFVDSNNEIFYLNTTMFQIISDEGFEYVGIGFVSTQEVEEKRAFHKKVIENIKNSNLKTYELQRKLNDSEKMLEKMKFTLSELDEQLRIRKDKISVQRGQIINFEKELYTSKTKLEKILSIKNNEVSESKEIIEKAKKEKTILSARIEDLKKQLASAYKENENKENMLSRKDSTIKRLEDLLAHREEQLKEIDPKLIS